MVKRISSVGQEHVDETQYTMRSLMEKALQMRCLAYLSDAKAQLLTQTIFEFDTSKKALVDVHSKLLRKQALIDDQRAKLAAQNIELQRAQEELESRVDDRTRELQQTNKQLQEAVIQARTTMVERQKLEQQIYRSQKMEAIGQLTGGIAHDYNNMLGVIMGNIQMVERAADLDDKSRQRLGKAMAAAHRNAELTGKLLGFSRKQTRATQLTVVNDCIANMDDIISTFLTASIEVEFKLHDDLWPVEIDPAELEDMILNLAINARDAMPDGGALVIETANTSLDETFNQYNLESSVGDYVIITVSDTGIGMSEEMREQIFDPFFSTKGTGKGTGLGLSMVYAFVRRSSGFIKVYSEPNVGTIFQFFLPRAGKHVDIKIVSGEVDDFSLPRGTETVLIVDDEDFLVELAVSQLEELGYHTLSAASGEDALDILKDTPNIDLLFTDIIMPGKLDGFDLVRAAKRSHPSMKVLLTSGFARKREENSSDDPAGLTGLAADMLNKPYTLLELAGAVRLALDK